jgi:Flp pilus assembly protein TadG
MNPTILSRAGAACRQRGAAAVELAVILSATMLLMLPALAFCVLLFYQYNVVKTASDDAAAYLASIPRAAFMTNAQRQAAKALAAQMVADAVTGAGITANTTVNPALVWCSGLTSSCSAVVPAFIGVEVYVELDVMGFSALYTLLADRPTNMMSYTVKAASPYVN